MKNNDWMLLITQDEKEREGNRRALVEAGYPEANILTTTAEEAADYLYGRLYDERIKRPGLIIVDLDHAGDENRARLKRLLKHLKEDPELLPIPLIMIVRGDHVQEDIDEWYAIGVNAVAARPNSHDAAVDFYRSLNRFWRERVVLPEAKWH